MHRKCRLPRRRRSASHRSGRTNRRRYFYLSFTDRESRGHSQNTIEEQLHRGNVYAVDIPYEQKDEQTYELLRQKLLAIDRGAGVLAVYDQKVLQQMLYTISCETGTQLRAVALPVTRFGMEWSKGAAIADGVDRVYRMAAESLGALWHSPKKVIVTLCTTSEGVALQMKQYLIQHKACTDAEVIALSLSDRNLLREKLLELMQGAVIAVYYRNV